MKSKCHTRLIVKYKNNRPVELGFYGLHYIPDDESFLYPLYESRIPQRYCRRDVTQITRKMKTNKLLIIAKKPCAYS